MRNKIFRTILALIVFAVSLANFTTVMAQETTSPPAATNLATPPATTTAPTPASAREGFSLTPSDTTSTVHNFTFEMKAGETQTSKAFIKNFSSSAAHFYLYGADPTVSNTGSLAYETRDRSNKGPGSWIKFSTPEIDLNPDEDKVVDFTVTVPADTQPGEYRAGITMEKTKIAANNPGITIATRVVSQAKITVTTPDGQVVPATASTTAAAPTVPVANPFAWQSYYFWISFGLFLASLALLIWTILSGRKTKAQRAQHSAHTHAHDHKAHTRSTHAKGKHERK
jgi:hypothetical protein